uniref:Molybdopterin-guanine dinucleotide biosynthesis protein B (MobB) domain-containing protein n=1 Tax=Caldisericum exile TaxID=693075 RepID=A0A7C4XT06_9BACT
MPKIVLIGGSKSNVGKTTLARIILRIFPEMFVALKITNNTLHGVGINEENYETASVGKDTYFFLEHAKRVFWIKGEESFLKKVIPEFIKSISDPVLAEGNVMYDIVRVSLFFFVEKSEFEAKKSAIKYKNKADFIIVNRMSPVRIEDRYIFLDLQKALNEENEALAEFLKHIFREKGVC